LTFVVVVVVVVVVDSTEVDATRDCDCIVSKRKIFPLFAEFYYFVDFK